MAVNAIDGNFFVNFRNHQVHGLFISLKNLRVPNTVRYLDSMGFKYTKSDLEMIVHRQLANLEVLGEMIKLLEKQNELLVKYNHKLIEELSDRKPPIPYPKISRKKSSQ